MCSGFSCTYLVMLSGNYNDNTLMFYLFPFMRDGSINSVFNAVTS